MVNIKLTLAQKANFKEIAKIYQDEFSKPPFNEDRNLEDAVIKLEIFSKYCDVWEIGVNEEIAGFIVINPNHWNSGKIIFAEEMAVKEKYQREGIGTETFKELFSIYKNKGFEEYIGIVNKNSKSFGFHKKIGAKIFQQDVLMGMKL